MGDGILAYFGYAQAHDSPRRAQSCRGGPEARDRRRFALAGLRWNRDRALEAELYRVRGDALIACGHCQRAEESYQVAHSVARRQGAKLWELRAATSLARHWCDQGKRTETRDLLAPIYNWFTEGLDTPVLARRQGAARPVSLMKFSLARSTRATAALWIMRFYEKCFTTLLAMRSICPGSSVTGPSTRYWSPAFRRSSIRVLMRSMFPIM
jgi:hypothetical protein